ncbi:hypothetical protein NEIG_01095 [Nematocida sp. ERTm5]|nr:hypothetical protein NEIG_01095 [Nematocida sp. ERTm5]
MGTEKELLEYSPLLYITDREGLFRLLQKNYSDQKIKRLFHELQKYNVLYFCKILTEEEVEEMYITPDMKKTMHQNRFIVCTKSPPDEACIEKSKSVEITACSGCNMTESLHKSLDKMGSDEVWKSVNRTKEDLLGDIKEAEELKCSNDMYVRRCFDSYYMRNRTYLYAEDSEDTGDFDRMFLSAYYKYVNGEYLCAFDRVEELLRRSTSGDSVHFGCRLHLLSIGASAAHRSGSYYDAVWMCKAGILLSESVEFTAGSEFFKSMLETIEAAKEEIVSENEAKHTLISSYVNGLLNIPITLEDKFSRCLQYKNEITLLRDVKIYDTREIACSEIGNRSILEYINKIKGIGEKCQDISPIVVYSIDGCIAFGLIYYNEKAKMSVIKSKIYVKTLLARLANVQKQNRDVLKRVCTTPEQKQEWWRIRISLDNEIKKELIEIDKYIQRYAIKGHVIKDRVALVIEDILGSVPFEMCNSFVDRGVFRCSSLCHILSSPNKTESKALEDHDFFYVLNPEKNLIQTEERIVKYINKYIPHAAGIKNRIPLPMETEQAILSHRIFMYFGHGGGEKFFTPRKLRRIIKNVKDTELRTKSIFLFGCSSARISAFPMHNTHSTCISYMHIPVVKNVVGALWDITDKDLDITSIGIMEAIKNQNEPLSVALNRLKRECKLKYLNGAAIVLYGMDE